jgi:hypothetical protein
VSNKYTSDTPEDKIQRFWNKVNKDGSIPAHVPHLGKCWEWTAGCGTLGYGHHKYKTKTIRAHRFSWCLFYGEIPDGLNVLHKCDNRKCVNPDHLFLGTIKDNVDDMIAKGRKLVKEGEKSHLAILTSVQVIEIRRRFSETGVSQSALGRQYGVSNSTIHDIVRRKKWKHI